MAPFSFRLGVLLTIISTLTIASPAVDLIRRQATATNYCKRWSQQAQIVNGTLYVYGGRATTEASQSTNEWNNDFFGVDLTKSWQITSPPITAFPQPNGPPAVANGYLWASYDSLFLYGGEFQDKPAVTPAPVSMWEYSIGAGNWVEHSDPATSAGNNAPSAQVPVQRAAEGAGLSVPSIGRGWYFGGHEDLYTTLGWSYLIPRVYLTSLLEFTYPGYTNNEVTSLASGSVAGSDGAWRNVTEGKITNAAAFSERADGVLVYIPGFSDDGILLGMAGGQQAGTYTDVSTSVNSLNIIDVYDIATSSWYQQTTSGSAPKPRVNPCAVVAAAADGSSYQVYMFGGQSLAADATQQVQYNDMWILSVPSFTWVQVDTSKQSVPPGRAGHTCHMWDGQLISVGGYVGDIGCEQGYYVFNASSLEWQNSFMAMSEHADNPLSQQTSQLGKSTGMQGSYGYQVPVPVQSAIGGGPSGGAKTTSPISPASDGPLASGSPLSYPVTGGTTPSKGVGSTGSAVESSGGSTNNTGAIVAGVVAGVAGLIAIYLGYVTFVYRKRMKEYKDNVDRFGWMPSKETSQENSRGRSRGTYEPVARSIGPGHRRTSSTDLLGGKEPTFVGIMLHPRRSLRVTNPDQ